MKKIFGLFFVAFLMMSLVACSIKADESAVSEYLKKVTDDPEIAVHISGELDLEVEKSMKIGNIKEFYFWVRIPVTDTFEKLTNAEKYKLLKRTTEEIEPNFPHASPFNCGKNAVCLIDKLIFNYEDKEGKKSKSYSFDHEKMHTATIDKGDGSPRSTSEEYNPTPERVTPEKKPEVKVGMTADEITSILGKPDEILNTEPDSKGEVRYRWRYEGRGYIYFADHKALQILFND
ncbi:hypothetical protein [Cohnella phaseoli]|uniref:SmpA/OmlA family protein n=1 Tax=Cohnella phaseoli TaxID=456490 RepID=A0A3D9JPY4_9BACL|nr:hypothetical protein [Cohnella phaseoli]RED76020.1 hypothetical protein DFP98_11380 [Cohnella phaseoli]